MQRLFPGTGRNRERRDKATRRGKALRRESAGAGGWARGAGSMSIAPRRRRRRGIIMRIGVGEWGFRDLPFEDHCRIARKFGFRCLELGMGGDFSGRLQYDWPPSEWVRVRECIRDYGLKTPFMCLENDFTKGGNDDVAREAERVRREAERSASLGVTHLRLFAGFTPAAEMTEEKWRNMIRAFLKTDEAIRPLGMAISIETHGALAPIDGGFRHTPTVSTDKTSLARLLAELPESVGINFDPGNLKPVQPEPVESYLELLEGRVNYCHLKDWVPRGGGWEAVGVGDGDMDWKGLLDALAFDGVHLIEYEPVHDVEDGIRRSLAHLERAMGPLQYE
jgi:sugar phosphate isomerase/epimerase